jgi:hypothetical protein
MLKAKLKNAFTCLGYFIFLSFAVAVMYKFFG